MLVHTYTHFCADVNPSLTFDDYRDGLYLELYNHLLAISHDCIFKVAEVRGLYTDIVFLFNMLDVAFIKPRQKIKNASRF